MSRFQMLAHLLVVILIVSLLAAEHGRARADEEDAGPRTIAVQLGQPSGKRLSPLHFAANTQFFHPGLAHGVTDKRDAFARALQSSGIKALRFPGGNAAYFYLPESRELTMQLAHATGHWEFREDAPPNTCFVTLEQLAEFARGADIQLVYELPCLLYLDGETPRAIIKSKLSDRTPELFDRKRIEEGVAYGLKIVRRLRELEAPVAVWELGNEEFAHCSAEDYAEVAAAYARGIRQVDATTPIVAVGMGKGWLPAIVPILRDAGVRDKIHSFQVHYPFGNWPGPGSPEKKGDAAAFVGGDVRFERWLSVHAESRAKLGLPPGPVSVTETMVMRHQSWDPHAVIGTQAHALCYAWNWMALLEHPDVDMAVFHDLESPYFGMLRYDVGFDLKTRHFVWLDAAEHPDELAPKFDDEYVLSPTCYANRLLSELVGEELVATNIPTTPTIRALASRERIVIVNRGREPVRLRLPFPNAAAEALTADSLAACLPGSYRIAALETTRRGDAALVDIPARSVAAIRREKPGG